MIKSTDLQELRAETFELRCGAMRLFRSTSSKEEGSEGTGYVRQLPSGDLSMVMFVSAQPPQQESLWGTGKRKSGELLSDDDYFILEALDFAGRRWEAFRLRPQFTQFVGDGESLWMAEATFRELGGRERLTDDRTGASLVLWYRGDIDFPFQTALRKVESTVTATLSESMSIAAAEFEAADCAFQIRQESGYLAVSAGSSSTQFPPNFERRVNEALELLLARRLSWAAVERREGSEVSWRLTGAPRNENLGRMQLPVAFTSGLKSECDGALDLFRRYLERVSTHRGDGLPPMSVAVKCALEGARSPLDAHALDIAVAVESILAKEFSELGQSTERFEKDLASVKGALETLPLSKDSRRRLCGALGAMSSATAKGRLLDLVKANLVPDAERRAWESVRHRGAHGSFLSGVDQDYVDAFWRLVTLFYRLVFIVVGYDGPYRDYGEIGWPWRGLES